jgi:hypothetical protein
MGELVTNYNNITRLYI